MRLFLVLGLLFGVPLVALAAAAIWPRDVWANFDHETTWNGELVPASSGDAIPRPRWGDRAVLRADDGSYWYLRPLDDGGLDYRTADGRDGFLHGGLVTTGGGHFRYFDNWSNAESRWQLAATSFETDGRIEADCLGFSETSVTARVADSARVYAFDLVTPSPDSPAECTLFPSAS
ncbi:MAG: hypothetical protein CMM84_06050 [Rhodothermaceae bacterium]|nr:hypothetical protein [Rhodothermaceae bacterium]